MDAASYRRAVAECVRDAVSQGLIERYYRVGRGARKVTQDASQMSVCFYLVDRMVESPYWTHEPRLFVAVEPLEPELSRCITELRRLIHVEQHVERGMRLLAGLQARVSAADVSEPISQLWISLTSWNWLTGSLAVMTCLLRALLR